MAIVRTKAPGPTQQTGAGQSFATHTIIVETKNSWLSDWEVQPDLQVIGTHDAVAPSVGSATFRYAFGTRSTEDNPVPRTLEALNLQDHYVRVRAFTVDAPQVPVDTWVGQLVLDGRDPSGIEPPAAGGVPAGQQVFTAFGMEHLLKKMPINETRILDETGTIVLRTDENQAFNRRDNRGGPLVGNMSFEPDAGEPPQPALIPVFDARPGGIVWTARTIIVYLLNNFVNGRTTPEFVLSGQVSADLGEQIYNLAGMTVWDALNRVLDRRRGMAWKTRVVDGGPEPYVEIVMFSILPEALDIAGIFIPANPNQTTIDIDPDIKVRAFQVQSSSASRYSEVLFRGARIRVMCTLSPRDSNLDSDWSDEQEAAYKAGASDSPGYDALSVGQKARLNDEERVQNDALASVYRRFVIPKDWTGHAGDGLGTNPTAHIVLPQPFPDLGRVLIDPFNGPADMSKADQVLLRELLIEEGKDYSVSPVVDNNDGTTEPAFQRPFIGMPEFSLSGKFYRADMMGAASGNSLPPVSMQMLRRGFGFNLVHPSGQLPHSWAQTDWFETEPSLFKSTGDNQTDWRFMFATVAFETDKRPTMRVNTASVLDNNTVLTIDIEDIQYWYGVPGTVIGIKARELVRLHGNNQVIRDDTPRLREIAVLARAWYGRERHTVNMVVESFDAPIVGSILKALSFNQSTTQVDTIVSSVRRDYLEQTTQITTEFIELDIVGLTRRGGGVSGGSSPQSGTVRQDTNALLRRVNKLERETADSPVREATGGSVGRDGFIGRIVAWHEDKCNVERMLFGDPDDWGNAEFSGSLVECVWTGVATGYVCGDPVWVWTPPNSSKPVAMAWVNVIGDHPDGSGVPDPEYQAVEPSAGEIVPPGPGFASVDPDCNPGELGNCGDLP